MSGLGVGAPLMPAWDIKGGVRPRPTGGIQATVRFTDGTPAENAQVIACPSSKTAITGPDGMAGISNLNAGTYTVKAKLGTAGAKNTNVVVTTDSAVVLLVVSTTSPQTMVCP